MRLVNYGPGELSDRLSILALKRLFASEAGRDLTSLTTEWAALLSEIRSRTLNGKWFEAMLELTVLNAAIWHAEDDLRALRQRHHAGQVTDWDAALRCACRPQTLNDQRAALVAQINKDAGEGPPSDKQFAREDR